MAPPAQRSQCRYFNVERLVHLVKNTYEKGVKVLSDELKQYQPFWQRSETLPKWEITIIPT